MAKYQKSRVRAAPRVASRVAKALNLRVPARMKAAYTSKSWKSKVDKLLSGHRKMSPDILRLNASMTAAQVYSYCLTSDATGQTGSGITGAGAANSASGMLLGNEDQSTVHSVRISGCFDNRANSSSSIDGFAGQRSRIVVIYFTKPATLPTSLGTLPVIGEILDPDILNTWQPTFSPEQKQLNNLYTVLSDRTFDCGWNLQEAGGQAAASVVGTPYRQFDYTVKVNKQVKFMAPATEAFPGGHFDEDVDAGQVNKGLLVMYVFTTGNSVTVASITTRTSFTM